MPPRSKAKEEPEVATTMTSVTLMPVERATVEVPIIGLTPVIPHKWSEKALRMMREAQSGPKTRTKHDPKVPTDEAEGCLYRLPDGTPGLPATAFKAAIVGAARLFAGVTMTTLKTAVFVEGVGPDQLVAIQFPEGGQHLREDTPRNATGVVDLRYRYSFYPWSAIIRVEFLTAVVDVDSIFTLVDAAGNGGVGDWRPSAPKSLTGTFGRFQVQPSKPSEPSE